MSRAMTPAAKEQKKQFIIEQAFKLYESKTFNDFRMEDLAQTCEISKGLLFKYFRTKEILFFHMLDIEYSNMLRQTEKKFLEYELITPEILRDVLIELTKNLFRPESNLVRLSRIKNIILEQNVDYEFAVKHKLTLAELSNSMMSSVMQRLDGVTPQQFNRIFSVHTALLYGYLNSHTTSSMMKQVIQEYNLKQYDIDPIKETIESLKIFINGYLNIDK